MKILTPSCSESRVCIADFKDRMANTKTLPHQKIFVMKRSKPLEKQECSFLYICSLPSLSRPHSSKVPGIFKNSFFLFLFFLQPRISLLKRVKFKNFLKQFLTLAHILKTCKDEISDKCSFLPTKFGLFRKLKYKAAKSFD